MNKKTITTALARSLMTMTLVCGAPLVGAQVLGGHAGGAVSGGLGGSLSGGLGRIGGGDHSGGIADRRLEPGARLDTIGARASERARAAGDRVRARASSTRQAVEGAAASATPSVRGAATGAADAAIATTGQGMDGSARAIGDAGTAGSVTPPAQGLPLGELSGATTPSDGSAPSALPPAQLPMASAPASSADSTGASPVNVTAHADADASAGAGISTTPRE